MCSSTVSASGSDVTWSVPDCLVRDMENSYLTLESRDDTAMDDLLGHAITAKPAFLTDQISAANGCRTLQSCCQCRYGWQFRFGIRLLSERIRSPVNAPVISLISR